MDGTAQMEDDYYVQYRQWVHDHVIAKNANLPTETEARDGTLIPIPEVGKISSGEELRFLLYRHWSLYDSM